MAVIMADQSSGSRALLADEDVTGKPQDTDAVLEAQYNNRALVPDHPAVMARWKAGSETARATHPPQVLKYGPSERERIDWFDAGDGAPVVVFLHGGYWQALDASWFSFVAPPLLAHGVSVAIPTYDLAPSVRLGRIVDQVRTAVDLIRDRTGAAPVVSGHSAGGHMAACLLADGRASAAVALSGVFDLEPLVPTSLNVALDLNTTEARSLSPIRWAAPAGAVLDCIVGGAESEAFVDQSRDMAARWGDAGAGTRFEALPGLNHFTVLDPLFDAQSTLVRRLADLAHRR
ncbi:alpha/beta hydrolase [uncultured Brevundimonas sp.]|uniref:alpha/beta hydrolase n=1 Tax=uncultured Brevundimonas sp. TaxID=213418 RepID=UPI0025E1C670|nr:alpha/beta hydrolase [uncultured Brevundimonas sp.]